MVKRIIKRDGRIEEFKEEKIVKAISKTFKSLNETLTDEDALKIIRIVKDNITEKEEVAVEEIQDEVEKALMTLNFFDVAKSYIIYRNSRSEAREYRNFLINEIKIVDLKNTLKNIEKDFTSKEYSLLNLINKYKSFVTEESTDKEKVILLIKAAVELTSADAPKWEFIASRLRLTLLYSQIKAKNKQLGITNFYAKVKYCVDHDLYGDFLLDKYTEQEIDFCEKIINKNRDKLISYSSLELLVKRYLVKDYDNSIIETPQEMFMAIAMHIAMNEHDKLIFVKKVYDIISKFEFTFATPTMANARRPFHQLSSCFIDTVDDSLDGIFKSITNFSTVSKFGGGMGLYFGKVRANGSSIRGYKGAAGGIIRWIKIVNDVAVAVDQLGVRAGAVACYLDVWHKDLIEFLQIRTNNGDDRMKAYDVFPAICYPDYFWKMARDNINSIWTLLDPHEVFLVKGYHLEDYYGQEWENKYLDCVHDPKISKREIPIKEIIRLIIKSAVETGTPFCFNRDLANEANPNKHKGIIYCSNLCTEIMQNTSSITDYEKVTLKTRDGDDVVVEKTKAGDFVTCNLGSLCLGNIDCENDTKLEEVINVAVRALDNIIDLNMYPLEYAKLTSNHYRSIGLGVSGYHHLLAKKHIHWNSEEHLLFADKLFEKINFYTIKASNELAKEKGSYDYFSGSDWETGAYFTKRGYFSKEWLNLQESVSKNGLRNAYLLAIAPTASTSIISSTTAGVDPAMKKFFYEEKRGQMIPRVAPELSGETINYYESAYDVNQIYTIKAAGVRQKHIDQSSSINLYITNDFTMRQVLELYIKAWENGLKTIYYVRSKSLEVEECEGCAS